LDKKEFLSYLNSYDGISECIKTHDTDEILSTVSNLFNKSEKEIAIRPMGGYSKGKTSGCYLFVLNDLKQNIGHYDHIYSQLYDEESKRVFHMLVAFRICPDMSFIKSAYDGDHPQYFDTNIVNCTEDEIFVDCGGYIGDTAKSYIDIYGKYKKIYVYEPDHINYEKACSNLSEYNDIIIKLAGVGDKTEMAGFSSQDSAGSFLSSEESNDQIQLISIDQDIQEPVSFIKMDIEGFEIPALIGARDHIKKDHPKLAICLYHIVSDLWEIPELISGIYPDYHFYIRHYEEKQNWETVLYAIPPSKRLVHNKMSTVATICPFDRPWENVDLTKDCGLLPYLFYREYGMNAKLIGSSENPADYPSLNVVNGIELVPLPRHDINTKLAYIEKHAHEIDLLLLYGGHNINALISFVYKNCNPNGLIYCGLDANSFWMDRFDHTQDFYQSFLDNCDVLAASCTCMADFLTKKWHKKIHLITNGYYELCNPAVLKKDFSEKENVILTVGRLGTKQKNTELLLNAFASVSDSLPGWILKLVGPIDESFVPFMDSFFASHPQLRDRVVFIGPISKRETLMEEYEHAKIFALPSEFEGAPNVISEALTHGCVSAVTKFDAFEDCIDHGECGRATDLHDENGFANILKELCLNQNLQNMSDHARSYAARFFDMRKNVEKIYDLFNETVDIRR
jgi:FkbM family methyltransferase